MGAIKTLVEASESTLDIGSGSLWSVAGEKNGLDCKHRRAFDNSAIRSVELDPFYRESTERKSMERGKVLKLS